MVDMRQQRGRTGVGGWLLCLLIDTDLHMVLQDEEREE